MLRNQFNFEELRNNHDLRLPDWGPYTKKYMGISHLSDKNNGIRFDLSVFPGFYRKRVEIPNVLWESSYHPWEASPDLTYFSHRHELEWKDKVYCDISFSEIEQSQRLIRCECINNTSWEQNLVIHYMASINFPAIKPLAFCGCVNSIREEAMPCKMDLPEASVWVDALDYCDIGFSTSRPTDNLVYDAFLLGEVREQGLVGCSGLGNGFGKEPGDFVTYKLNLDRHFFDAVLVIRYIKKSNNPSFFMAEGIYNKQIELQMTDKAAECFIRVGDLKPGEHFLKLTSMGGGDVIIDGFVITTELQMDQVHFLPSDREHNPEIISCDFDNSFIVKYSNVQDYYGITWMYDSFEKREFLSGELDRFMRFTVHNHVSSVLKGDEEGHFTNAFLRPITIPPNSKKIIYGMTCCGSKSQVEKSIYDFNSNEVSYEEVYTRSRSRANSQVLSSMGQEYKFSQQLMAATTLTNVVFPTYIKRSYIRHSTPGRWWDSLYTWDSGFIGLGLAELDIHRAVDCLNAYVTEPGDNQCAFIHHGSFVPVQIFLFLELWNKTQSKELLEYFYPRLKQYYNFLSGTLGSSTTRQLKSNILKTWDYFYNSGGWDDYPPQAHVHRQGLQKSVAPVVSTAMCIRSAKILCMAAEILGLEKDVEEYKEDIGLFGNSLQKYSWDEESGYFGYVCHNEEGNPVGILRHESGKNFNMGLDGIYPLVAGICTDTQEQVLCGYLQDENRLWTPIGITTVDQSAPYYKPDGYWNGAVWMPHQWFIWKTMLDLGKGDLAYKIAKTALELWKNEVDESYNCFEHFIVQSGRGAGWHHFGGLSTPVLCWFNAYHLPGRITCGFNVWIYDQDFTDDYCSLKINFKYSSILDKCFNIIVCMRAGHKYNVILNGIEMTYKELNPGVLQINMHCYDINGCMTIEPV